MQLAKALLAKWASRKHGYSVFASLLLVAHGPKNMDKKGKIFVSVEHM